MEQKIIFEDDACYVETPIESEYATYALKELVMTKEAFIQCYEKWIMENKDGYNSDK